MKKTFKFASLAIALLLSINSTFAIPGICIETPTAPGCPGSFTPSTSQTITFPVISDKLTTDADFQLAATGGPSGMPVTYVIDGSSSVCSVSTSGLVHILAVGTCTIVANQAGDATNYLPASPVSRSFTITAPIVKKDQAITFDAIGDQIISDGSIVLNATADSSLPVSYEVSSDASACSVSGTNTSEILFDNTGDCTVIASQSGDSTYNSAKSVSQSFRIEDADGVNNATEDAGPNNGDSNNDGIKDSEQANVVSFPDKNLDGGYVSLELSGSPSNPSITSFSPASHGRLEVTDGSTFPVEGFSFSGQTNAEGNITVKIILDKEYDTTGWTLKKNDGESRTLKDGPTAIFDTVVIDGVTKTRITYTIRDNDETLFDQDRRSGYISDPVFPVVPPVVVPSAPSTASNGSIVVPSALYSNSGYNYVNPSAQIGQVLGTSTTCGVYLDLENGFLARGNVNDPEKVKLLKKFLNKELGTNLEINGYFGPRTEEAVKKFQLKYQDKILAPWGIDQPTGIVYVTTALYINYLECPILGYTLPTGTLTPIK